MDTLDRYGVGMRVRGVQRDGKRFELSAVGGVWAEPDAGPILDVTALVSLPGLIDAHAHLSGDRLDPAPVDQGAVLARAAAAAEAGVAVCLDKGWSDDTVLEMVRSGTLSSPRVAAAGAMVRTVDGYWEDFGVETDDAGAADVVAVLAADRPWVKLVGDWPRKGQGALPNFSEEALTRVVEVAHAAGARVAIHTAAPGVPSAAVRAGVDSIEHGLFLTEDDLGVLAGRGGVWVPTVLRMEETLAAMKPGSSGAEVLGRGLQNMRSLLPVAAEMGVVVMSGSDMSVAPAAISREVAALVRSGLPPEAAVAGASTAGASAVGLELSFAVGAPADLVAYDTDPVADPGVLERPTVVISQGRLVRGPAPG